MYMHGIIFAVSYFHTVAVLIMLASYTILFQGV